MINARISSLAMIAAALMLSGLAGCVQPDEQEGPEDLGSVEQHATFPTTGLHLWLRSDIGVTASPQGTSSALRVTKWLDQSGNGRHASMSSATSAALARQPYYVTGALNGLPVIQFQGGQSLGLDIWAQPTSFTVFVVGKNANPSESFSMILGPGGNAPNNQLRWENGSNALFVGTGNAMPAFTSPIGNTRVYHALSGRYDNPRSLMEVFRDGNPISTHSFRTTGPWTLASVGSWYSTYYMRGELAEVIIYDRPLSETERVAVNSYLEGKYGI